MEKSKQNDITENNEQPPGEQKRIGCPHYKRRAKFVTPCCNKFYMCRYCHDENEEHYFNGKTVTELICTECDTRQKVQAECEKCGVRFGRYTCLVCNLFDDEDKKQYHCDGCGICRSGGRDKYFHCEVCNMCLPMQLKTNGHRCVENVSRSNCPVCLENLHTSRIPSHIPDCGHLLHRTCFEKLLQSGHYACPTCQTSMIDMTDLWNYLDSKVAMIPMPPEYSAYKPTIICNDCHKISTVKFHIVGLKCSHCGGYNTCQTRDSQREGSGASDSSNGASTSNVAVAVEHPLDAPHAKDEITASVILNSASNITSNLNNSTNVSSNGTSDSSNESGSQLLQPSINDEPPQA